MRLLPSEKERQWAMACHLLALPGLVLMPIGSLIGPFVIWTTKKRFHPFINEAGKSSINFQISMMLWALLSFALVYVGVGIALLIVLAALNVIFVVMASFEAAKGRTFKYPLTIRILK